MSSSLDLDEELSIYDQIEIEDMSFDATLQLYTYPCPCGDRFEILLDDLRDGQQIAVCPSCSLMIQVIFEPEDLPAAPTNTGTNTTAVTV
ncbi:diphthamide biosynthesis protein [Tricharina praecox]|uniref:diphthamide biosynthesis protein n=1 Tax=Tricharina praecox TaxID=43433 RepID=UPI00221FCA39|nr:diphthamide biosynthesis protein [Tricharina praecox]XP_051342322.1 diphthamide biosynthesis protein [Tricharina praecox]KAI5841214.1 diphthamide biosynthesis protein [Tricharina praecox]KAI5856104.1 diphthamide biosynthesis protein [Tricharina praecox]